MARRKRTAKNGQAWLRLLPTANRAEGGHLFYLDLADGTRTAQPPEVRTDRWTLHAPEVVEAFQAHPTFAAIIEVAHTPNPPDEEQ